jgi:nitrogen fixation NifU-like protein
MSAGFDEFAEELQESMMEEIRKKYTPAVIDHWRNPRNFRRLQDADGQAVTTGPCGDTMEIYVQLADGRIAEATFFTDGCGTTIACGSIVTELIKDKSLAEAESVSSGRIVEALGGLPPPDEHCAVLAAAALGQAIVDSRTNVRKPWETADRRR